MNAGHFKYEKKKCPTYELEQGRCKQEMLEFFRTKRFGD